MRAKNIPSHSPEEVKLLNSINVSAQNELPIPFLPGFRPLVSSNSRAINSISDSQNVFGKFPHAS